MLSTLPGDEMDIILNIAPRHQWVRVDPVQFEQVIVNLVVNAHDAMANGGTLRITVANIETPRGERPGADPTLRRARPRLGLIAHTCGKLGLRISARGNVRGQRPGVLAQCTACGNAKVVVMAAAPGSALTHDRQAREQKMDADSLKGMAVVSIVEAARLGTITEVLFETQPLRVGALQATGKDSDFGIPFAEVRTVGPDAVMVESSQVTQIASGGSAFGQLTGLGDLRKLKVVDEAGTLLGTIQAVELDPATGHVVRLQARKGGVMGVGADTTAIDAGAIRSVGTEVLTVTAGGKA